MQVESQMDEIFGRFEKDPDEFERLFREHFHTAKVAPVAVFGINKALYAEIVVVARKRDTFYTITRIQNGGNSVYTLTITVGDINRPYYLKGELMERAKLITKEWVDETFSLL